MISTDIPLEIKNAYFGGKNLSVTVLSGGMINSTLLVDDGEIKYILQKLSPIFNEDLISDYHTIVGHLGEEGWEMPALLQTLDGRYYVKDESGKLWRVTSYIEHDKGKLQKLDLYGEILGRLHLSLSKLDYSPKFSLPNFHDTGYYFKRLADVHSDIPTVEAQKFADRLSSAYKDIPELPDFGKQLIHADPRTDNILQRNGKPFTFIDWDTVMMGTIWMDIGDMLRSLAEDKVMKGSMPDIDDLNDVAEGYRSIACPDTPKNEFRSLALQAAQVITLELTARFVADYKEGEKGYFTWDNTKYESRHQHNMARAENQWKIYKAIQDYLQESIR